MSMSMPKTIAANGQTLMFEGIKFASCKSHINPAKSIITPMAKPIIAPPRGSPKQHSSSYLL